MKDGIAAPMAKLIPFPASRVRRFSARLLNSSASPAPPNAPLAFPRPPEALGNMLQRLARDRPIVVRLLENIAAEMLAKIARDGGGS